jgi:hypothetical protein
MSYSNIPISTQILRVKKKKKKSLKKDKLFNLLSMETLLEYVPQIKAKYEHLVRTSAALYGYHWNEVINTILYNKYVKNNPDIFQLYISIKNIVDQEKERNKKTSSLKEIMDPTKDYGSINDEIISQYNYNNRENEYGTIEKDIVIDDYQIKLKINKNTLTFKFYYNDSPNETNKFEQYKVFKFIIDVLNYTIKKENIKNLSYSSTDKKHNIYKKVLEKLGFKLIREIDENYFYEKINSSNELTETTTTASVFGGSGFPLMRGVFNLSKGQDMFDPKNKIVDKIKSKQINKDMSIVSRKQIQEKYFKNIDISNINEVDNFLNENYSNNIDEHHIESRKGKINFILSNSDEYSETDLVYCSDDEINDIYTGIENGKFSDNTSDIDKQILDAESLMSEINSLYMNEETKHPFLKNIDKINKENSKNSKTYFKDLNKGVQKMINRKSGSTESIEFEHDYDKDSKKLNVLRKAIDNTDNNKEYLEVVHRGLEDLEPTYPNKEWEKNSKKYMGDDLYNQGKKRRDEKKRLNQPNTPPGRMNTNLPKPKLDESSELITFYFINDIKQKEFITESKDNIRQNKFINKDEFIKLELVTPINEDTKVNFDNQYFYNQETGKIYYEKDNKNLTLLKESSSKFKQLVNHNYDKYDSKKTINKKIK